MFQEKRKWLLLFLFRDLHPAPQVLKMRVGGPMNLFKQFFGKKHTNPAIHALYRKQGALDAQSEKIILLLPKLAETYKEGGEYLLHKTLLSQFEEYDLQYGVTLSKEMTEEKSMQMLDKVTSLMLMTCFKVLSDVLPDGPEPSALTDGLHYEIYEVLPGKDSFVSYLTYQNPNFEDHKMAPAFKFGKDISEIVAMPDLAFSFLVSQQFAVISDVSGRLTRWVLFDEPMEPS